MIRSYVVLSVGLSFALMLAVGCSDDPSTEGGAGSGGTAGTGGTAGSGGGDGGTGGGVEAVTKELSLGCANSSPIGAQSILSAELSIAAAPIGGQEFDAVVAGTATFPESFLDAAQPLVAGGLSQAKLTGLAYIMQVRSGATPSGADSNVALTADTSQLTPGEVRLCNFPTDQECAADGDCAGGVCNAAVIIVDVPTSDDCAPGGVCDGLGKAAGPTSQCGLNGFCVTGSLDVPLLPETATFTADASGDVLFGWADAGLSNSSFDEGTQLFTIPKPSAQNPIEQGLKVDAGLVVAIECVMGTDEGPEPGNEDNDLVGLTPDADLLAIPITE
jgi:hypothetical protein